jgi:hypothetical protein
VDPRFRFACGTTGRSIANVCTILTAQSGFDWLAGLDRLVADLAAEWSLSIGRAFSGGTAALVAEARTAGGDDAVLKIPVPGLDEAP